MSVVVGPDGTSLYTIHSFSDVPVTSVFDVSPTLVVLVTVTVGLDVYENVPQSPALLGASPMVMAIPLPPVDPLARHLRRAYVEADVPITGTATSDSVVDTTPFRLMYAVVVPARIFVSDTV